MLQIKDMHEVDRLHGFLFGMMNWARHEVEKQEPKSYMEAMTMAERMLDLEGTREFGRNTATRTSWGTKSEARPDRPRDSIEGDMRQYNGSANEFVPKPSTAFVPRSDFQRGAPSQSQSSANSVNKASGPARGCYECSGNHIRANCLRLH